MKRNKMRLFSLAVLITLTGVASGCNLYAPAKPDYNATQAALLLLFTPVVNSPTPTLETSPTPTLQIPPTAFFTPAPPSILPTAGPNPSSYTLQSGEYPYCIARRFNIHPIDLLALNHLSTGMLYSPGLILYIPQMGRPFPTARVLHPHPTTYTIPEARMTVNKVACYFGDLEPIAILQYNGLTSPILTLGQTLQIP